MYMIMSVEVWCASVGLKPPCRPVGGGPMINQTTMQCDEAQGWALLLHGAVGYTCHACCFTEHVSCSL